MEDEKNVRRITIDLPAQLYRDLKQHTREHKTTMRQDAIRALRALLDTSRSPAESHVAMPGDDSFTNFDKQTASADEIWVAGLTLRGLRENFQTYLSGRVQQGVRLRLLLLDPDLGLDSATLRAVQAWVSGGAVDPVLEVADLVDDVRESVTFLQGLKSQAPDRAQVQVRGYNYAMGFGVTIADPLGQVGEARVSLYLFGGAASGARHPAMFFSSSAASMFAALREHFESLWLVAKPVT